MNAILRSYQKLFKFPSHLLEFHSVFIEQKYEIRNSNVLGSSIGSKNLYKKNSEI